MKLKNHYVTWTVLELSGLLEEKDAHVYFERTKKHLALHPFYLTNLQKALNENLSSMLNTYDTELKGFVLAYKNPKLLASLGETYYDSCFIHVDIEADFYLFRPKVGCSLKGIVNNKGLDHIVMLIHKTFTISIPKPDNTEQWAGDLVDIGQEVRCCVTQIDRNIKLPFICATLNSDYLQGCRLFESMHNIDNIGTLIENNNVDSNNEINDKSNIAIKSERNAISDRERKKNREKHMKKSRESDSDTAFKHKINAASVNNSGDDSSTCIKYEEEKQRKSIKREHSTLSTDHTLNVIELDSVSKKRKKNKTSKDVSPDSDSESHAVKIKVEKSDSQKSESTKMGNQSSFNSDNRNTNMDLNVESHKGVKREHSTDSISTMQKMQKIMQKIKREKHMKKSRESDSDTAFKDENNAASVNNSGDDSSTRIKFEEEKQCKTLQKIKREKHMKKSRESDSDTAFKHENNAALVNNSGDDSSIRIKYEEEKQCKTMQKIKREKYMKKSRESDSDTAFKDENNAASVNNSEDDSSTHIKYEEEKQCKILQKIKREKHMKKSHESDSDTAFRHENNAASVNNSWDDSSTRIKYEEEKQCKTMQKIKREHSTLSTDHTLNVVELDVPKKRKKNKMFKDVVSPDSDSESHAVKIKVEKSD